MKKIFYILATLSLLTACNDGFLDKKPLDKLSEEAVFNSDALAESYINAIYTVLPDPFTEGNTGCISDEGFFRYGG
ncbi:MAG: RagB/SusD family nutrient uptake outer membrane protein, partial [Bacteroidales bacterium]|nr:RagB/SusD family nutrient uptake outer membrane protein [Bacteroidales bacterium]